MGITVNTARFARKSICIGAFTLCICIIIFEAQKEHDGLRKNKQKEGDGIARNILVERAGEKGFEWVYSEATSVFFTKTKITVGQYSACIKSGNCERPVKAGNKPSDWASCNINTISRTGNYPMNCVSFRQSKSYCEWIGGSIPTLEQWILEFTNEGKWKYPWGNSTPNCKKAVVGFGGRLKGVIKIFFDLLGLDRAMRMGCGSGQTWPVCSKKKGNSVSGLCDMCGNVYEWVVKTSEYSDYIEPQWVGGSYFSVDCVYENQQQLRGEGHWDIGFRCIRKAIDFRSHLQGFWNEFWEKLLCFLRHIVLDASVDRGA